MDRTGKLLLIMMLVAAMCAGVFAGIGGDHAVHAAGNTYYVSPNGDDNGLGTLQDPWATFDKAAKTLQAGDTAIFEDGEYAESTTTVLTYNGTALNPITFKARNKGMAKLNYVGMSNDIKIKMYDRKYVTIQDFEITQASKGTSSNDTLIDAVNTTNCSIVGNELHNAYGHGIRTNGGVNLTIDQNLIEDVTNYGIKMFKTNAPIIKNNEIHEVEITAVTLSGGVRSAQIFNNYIHASELTMNFGIELGGISPYAANTFDPYGYEAYHSVAWNNKIISDVPGKIVSALIFTGSTDSAFYNNVVVGSQYGVRFQQGGQKSNPIPNNPAFKNNIFEGIENGAQSVKVEPIGLSHDYNLYFSVVDRPVESNGVYGDPKFADKYSDWHLQTGSLAAKRGVSVAFNDYNNNPIDISRDFDGIQRTGTWDIGIYASSLPAASIPAKPEPGGTYYVSPTGSDDNTGTVNSPWKTMAKAADSVQEGDTIIFEDGIYNETRMAVFAEGGTADDPIIVKARNKHKAVIVYHNMPTTKLIMKNKPYITLQDFEFTQPVKGTDTTDSLVKVFEGSDHVNIIGNKLHNANEEGIKVNLVEDVLIEGNYIYNMNHEGVDFVNVGSSIIRNNETYDVERVGLMVKGGSYDIQMYNNYVHNRNAPAVYGITIGGGTAAASTADPSANGYEVWNVVAYNNVVVSEIPGLITNGITFLGSKDSAAYNNIVSGAQYDIRILEPNNLANGWAWNPQNVNPVFKNNLLINATVHAIGIVQQPVNLVQDFNLYYNNAAAPSETNGVYADPLITDLTEGNWHLKKGSPAIGAAQAIASFTLRDGITTVDVSHDRVGIQRTSPSDMGVYATGYTYFVSSDPQTGSDANPGTEAQPWKTFAHAAATLHTGDTAIFEDGTYTETAAANFANSGISGAPITVKARNKHQAVLSYSGLNATSKINLSSKNNITIQDFEITQDVKGTTSADTFINNSNSSNMTIIGNRIHGAGAKGIRAAVGDYITIEQNIIYDIAGQGLYIVNAGSPIIKGNEISEIGNSGIYVAGGSRSAQISDNYIHASNIVMSYGILLGGSTSASSAHDPSGFEAYNAVAWNNSIVSETAGKIQYAAAFLGSKDSAFFNNVVIGSQYGVRFSYGGSGDWRPVPTNPTIMNNIFDDLTVGEESAAVQPVNLIHDYNANYVSGEAHGIYADPQFVNPNTDLHLQSGSPAIDAGINLFFTGYSGEPIDVSIDRNGNQRILPWDLGIY